jgi:hypothetical protein
LIGVPDQPPDPRRDAADPQGYNPRMIGFLPPSPKPR